MIAPYLECISSCIRVPWAEVIAGSRPRAAAGIWRLAEAEREVLEYRSGDGLLRGIVVWEAQRLFLYVDPEWRRRGVASRLMGTAVLYWPIDFEAQEYSAQGLAFFRAFLFGCKVRRAGP